MKKIILAIAALALSSTAFAMGTTPLKTVNPVEVVNLVFLTQDPIDAVNAQQTAKTLPAVLPKEIAENLKLLGVYSKRATAANTAGKAQEFHDNYLNTQIYYQKICDRLGNCAERNIVRIPG